jgi:hypothetical protein
MPPGVFVGGGALQHRHGVRHAAFEARGGAGVQFDGAAHDGAPSAALPLGRHRLVVGVEEAQRALAAPRAGRHAVARREAAAAQQRQHVGQHLAGGHDVTGVAQRPRSSTACE